MATEKDIHFLDFLVQETRDGRLKWEPTAEENAFTVSFKGKYTATVWTRTTNSGPFYRLLLIDDSDRELLRLTNRDLEQVETLYQLAQRIALNVDSAIDEIMGLGNPQNPGPRPTVTDEDIPF